MARIVLIGGTGTAGLESAGAVVESTVPTPYGVPSSGFLRWTDGTHELRLLARHGESANIPPHRVNYRANIHAIADTAPDFVIALNAVGGIAAGALPGQLAIPDQLIDYTWGRAHTFYDGKGPDLTHIEFTNPYDAAVRARLLRAAAGAGLEVPGDLTYGATQGPRLETAAEIDRMERDGCGIVGMTGAPEAALAAERGLAYACCALVVNQAAGRGTAGIHDEMQRCLESAVDCFRRLFEHLLQAL